MIILIPRSLINKLSRKYFHICKMYQNDMHSIRNERKTQNNIDDLGPDANKIQIKTTFYMKLLLKCMLNKLINTSASRLSPLLSETFFGRFIIFDRKYSISLTN